MAKVTTIEDTQQVLAVFLGSEMFGIPIAFVQGVLETLPLTYVPLAPPAVKGVMNLRGRIVTAIDLRTTLNGDDKMLIGGPQANMSIVIEEGGELYSLLVDTVGDVHTLSTAHIEEPPLTMADSLKNVTSGVFALRDRIMIILKPAALLNAGAEI